MARRGFTLIELLVVLAIIASLLTIALPRYVKSVQRAEESALRQNLWLMRDALDKHHADHGRYPDALQDLVRLRYLRRIPLDPLARADDRWVPVPPPAGVEGRVADVRSGAEGNGLDGTAYRAW
jgi:general secretion pathway protein G